ncbi:MAG TPA: hypothetical protein VGF33_03075 [Caulobacteraceae bacterium]|jgi:hypothetical protein
MPVVNDDLIREAFEAAADAVAGVFDLDPDDILAPSRGRGPRPPPEVWGPKKLVVYLTVASTNATYAEVARAVVLHKDTVASHCADVRRETDRDTQDALIEVLRDRLARAPSDRTLRRRRQMLRAFVLIEKPANHPSSSVDHATVIPFPRVRG